MYSRISYESYREAPCTEAHMLCCPSYVYSNVEDLSGLQVPESSMPELAWCRTVGILQSCNGEIRVCNINSTGGLASEVYIRASFANLKSQQQQQTIQSLVTPCAVQIFGFIKWHSGVPVVYVKLLQLLTVPRALQIKEIMDKLSCIQSQRLKTRFFKSLRLF